MRGMLRFNFGSLPWSPRLGLVFLILGGAAFSPARICGSDVVADFSTNANPNGVWSYGWATSAGGAFQLMTNEQAFITEPGGPDSGWWNDVALPDSCYIDKDYAGSNFLSGTVAFNTDTLHMDPQSYASIVRFTAPSNGSYQVAGLFRLQDTGTMAHNLSILLNTNITVFYVSTSGGQYNSNYPFSFPCTLNQGQTLDFIVSHSGTFQYLGTGLKATITPAPILAQNAYSAAAGFNPSNNPNGVWSYLYWTNSVLAGNAKLLFTNAYPVVGQSNVVAWWDNGTINNLSSAIVAGDETSNPYSETEFPNVIYYPDTLLQDPEDLAVSTRFTTPLSGVYWIQGFFRVQDENSAAAGTGALFQVITNMNTNSPVFSTNSHGAALGTQYPFSFTNSFSQGATVDFAVTGFQGGGVYLSSGLSAVIIPISPLLLSPNLSGGNFSFSFLSMSNQAYTVETTTNLNTLIWTTNSNPIGNGSLLQITVPATLNTPAQFFRVVVP